MDIYNILNNDLQEYVLSFVPEKTHYYTDFMIDYTDYNDIEHRIKRKYYIEYTKDDHEFLTDILNAEFYYKKNGRILPNFR